MIVRNCVRAILQRPDGRILLIRMTNRGADSSFWLTPGGGKEEGEADEPALRREVLEETGLVVSDVGPLVWQRDVTFDWFGETYRQFENFYWVKCADFEAAPNSLSAMETKAINELRWWSAAEIAACTEPGQTFAPSKISVLLEELQRVGAPVTPVAVAD